jgi:hypothetical protein
VSFKAVIDVLENSPSEHGARLVMISLAQHANPWWEAYPSVETIAEEARLSERAARMALRKLEEMGELQAVGVHEKYKTTVYRLTIGERGQKFPGADSVSSGGNITLGAVSDSAPKPTTNHQGEPPSGTGDQTALLPSPIEEVWAHFQAVIPNGARWRLDDRRRTVIRNALKVRSVEQCKGAIDWLATSSWHNGENPQQKKYLDVEFPLGGRKGESPDAVIDQHLEELRAKRGATGNSNPAHDDVRLLLATIPKDRQHIYAEHLRRVRARFAQPDREVVVSLARESEAALRAYPGMEVVEGADGTFVRWRVCKPTGGGQ